MGVSNKTRQIYEQVIKEVTKSPQAWKEVLKLAGQLYRFEFDNILMVFAQKPNATLIADYDTWKKVGRYVKAGSKGIAIFPSRALKPYMRYVFDISDTGGRVSKLTWDLEENHLEQFMEYQIAHGRYQMPDQIIGESVGETAVYVRKPEQKEKWKIALKDFTRERIRGIIKEEFDNRMTELTQITGSVIREFSEKREGLQSTVNLLEIVEKGILYVVGTRCGFELSAEEQDFAQIVNVTEEDTIYRLGSLICDVSCNVLKTFSKDCMAIDNERRMAYGSRNGVQGSERVIVPGIGDGEGGGESGRDREVRTVGDGVSERERNSKVQEPVTVRETGGEAERSGRRSQPDDTADRGELSEEAQAGESGQHDGNVEVTGAGKDDGGGDRTEADRLQVSLIIKQEIDRELDEINSLGLEKEAGEYVQASFFDAENGVYNYFNPKKETIIPPEYVKAIILQGTGFAGGMGRICKIFQTEIDAGTRANRIKKEYGVGGTGGNSGEIGLHGFDTYHSNGMHIQWRDDEGEKEGYLSWRDVEKEIGALILTGEYRPEQPDLNEMHLDGMREEESLDVSFEEIEKEPQIEGGIEVEENPESEENTLDDFAIPDEPDSYAAAKEQQERLHEQTKEMSGEPDFADELSEQATEEKAAEIKERAAETKEKAVKHNFRFNLWELPTGGAKTRYKWNVEAIKLLKTLEAEGRLADEKEQEILSRYAGWGGIPQAFDEKAKEWGAEYAELRELLTEEEYQAARATVNNAFYTSPEICSCIHQALFNFGFKNGNLLEPSMGTGNFFGSLPVTMQGAKLYGVEIDSISGRIAKQLYQKAKIHIGGFEKTDFPDNFFEVAVGNVPFGDYKVFDPKYNKYNFRIHDYFFAKALDQVRPGGIVAFVTAKGTLDKSNPTIRRYFAERAELIGAVRLPNTAFKDYAGTEVASDILFFQKREKKIEPEIEPDWVHLGYTDNGIPVNAYFVEHPEMMLGHMEYDTRMFGKESKYTTCVNDDPDFNLYEALNAAVENLKAQLTDFEHLQENEEVIEDILPADPDVRNFSYCFVDGKLYFRENSQMYRREVSESMESRIKGLDEIRKVTRHLIEIQTNGCSEEELAEGQRILNEKYNGFKAKYGSINSQTNSRAFRDDSDYPLLCSLEEVDEDGNVKKADMFYKQTIKPKTEIDRVETAMEALNVSVNEYGTVNLAFIQSIYHPDLSEQIKEVAEKSGTEPGQVNFSEELRTELERQKIIRELEGIIFMNPREYNAGNPNAGWEAADEYLSGNVKEKLREVRAMLDNGELSEEERRMFEINAASLEKVQPKDLDASEIEVRIGTTWIEPEDYEQFIYELLDTPYRARAVRTSWRNSGIQVLLNKKSMEWFIENKSFDNHSVAATKTHGTSRMDAYTIFENTLNLRTVTVRDRIEDGGGSYHYELNKNETMLAREKQS